MIFKILVILSIIYSLIIPSFAQTVIPPTFTSQPSDFNIKQNFDAFAGMIIKMYEDPKIEAESDADRFSLYVKQGLESQIAMIKEKNLYLDGNIFNKDWFTKMNDFIDIENKPVIDHNQIKKMLLSMLSSKEKDKWANWQASSDYAIDSHDLEFLKEFKGAINGEAFDIKLKDMKDLAKKSLNRQKYTSEQEILFLSIQVMGYIFATNSTEVKTKIKLISKLNFVTKELISDVFKIFDQIKESIISNIKDKNSNVDDDENLLLDFFEFFNENKRDALKKDIDTIFERRNKIFEMLTNITKNYFKSKNLDISFDQPTYEKKMLLVVIVSLVVQYAKYEKDIKNNEEQNLLRLINQYKDKFGITLVKVHDDYLVSKTEVTYGQYVKCVATEDCPIPAPSLDPNDCVYYSLIFYKKMEEPKERYPMNCITWQEANKYAEYAKGRLPTGEEWDHIAKTALLKFVNSCQMANINDGYNNGCGYNGSRPICYAKQGNTEDDVCDMIGNVWEYVQNKGDTWNSSHIIKGGGWSNTAYEIRTNLSKIVEYYERKSDIGFRIIIEKDKLYQLFPNK